MHSKVFMQFLVLKNSSIQIWWGCFIVIELPLYWILYVLIITCFYLEMLRKNGSLTEMQNHLVKNGSELLVYVILILNPLEAPKTLHGCVLSFCSLNSHRCHLERLKVLLELYIYLFFFLKYNNSHYFNVAVWIKITSKQIHIICKIHSKDCV